MSAIVSSVYYSQKNVPPFKNVQKNHQNCRMEYRPTNVGLRFWCQNGFKKSKLNLTFAYRLKNKSSIALGSRVLENNDVGKNWCQTVKLSNSNYRLYNLIGHIGSFFYLEKNNSRITSRFNLQIRFSPKMCRRGQQGKNPSGRNHHSVSKVHFCTTSTKMKIHMHQ